MRRRAAGRAEPIVELLIPSVVDDSLAPPGMHVASLFCQHVHPDLPQVAAGRTWDDARDEVADLMIDTVNRVAPNFRASVLGRRALSPLDLEREFGLIGGDIFHGRADARPALRGAPGAGPRRLPDAGARPLPVRLRRASGRRRDRRAGAQRGARDPARRAAPAWTLIRDDPAPHLGARIAALGIAQIVSWGTLFYTIAVLGAAMRADLGVSDTLLFGAFSAGLFVSGAAVAGGRTLDRSRDMRASRSPGGSCVGAVALALLAVAQGPASRSFAGWHRCRRRDGAYALRPRVRRRCTSSAALRYRRAVTALTLFGGFASTVFWPLSHSCCRRRSAGAAAFGVFAVDASCRLPAATSRRDSARGTDGGRSGTDRREPPPAASGPSDGARRFAWLALALSRRVVHRRGAVGARDRAC